jgi:hypothetical protein
VENRRGTGRDENAFQALSIDGSSLKAVVGVSSVKARVGRVPLSSLRDTQPPPGAAQSLGASAPTPSSRKACAAGTDAGCGGVAVGKGIEISTWRGWNGGGVIGEISGCAEGLGSGKEKNTNLAAGPERRKGAHSHVLNENLALRYVVVGLPRFPRVVPALHVAHGLRTIRAVAPHRGPPRVPRANFENCLSRGFRPRVRFFPLAIRSPARRSRPTRFSLSSPDCRG